MTNRPRPTLTLKKKPALLAPPAAQPTPPPPAKNLRVTINSENIKVAPTAKTVKDMDKEVKRLENIRLGNEAAARKREHLERCKPLVDAYFAGRTIFTDMVIAQGVECLRPLAIGTRQRIIADLAALPQCEGVSATALNELVTAVLHAHTTQEAYQRGILLLGERFQLDGTTAGEVEPKHQDKAQTRIVHAGGTQ